MKDMKVKGIELTCGRPKVAVPLTGQTQEEIIKQCQAAIESHADILEWRADYFLSGIENLEEKLNEDSVHIQIIRILDDIDYVTGGMPVIFTIRSKSQGGRIALERKHIDDLSSLAAQSQLAAFVDVEIFDENGKLDSVSLTEHVNELHSFGCKVIMSYHDFKSMPKAEEIANLVNTMRDLDADIPKVAGYAHTKKDAVNMVKISQILTQGDNGPVILVGMGKNGIITRIFGGQYGSVITFASAGEASAPGQIDAKTINRLLDEFYVKQ
ncbi:MAG: type I 3-dehydroquinate dehydratase [Bacillota bacterium]|nr:type I 3-dehydroquinate dehydratase [Bacillota bacterium]